LLTQALHELLVSGHRALEPRPEVQDEWGACADGLRIAEARASALDEREDEPEGFEALLGTVQRLIEPLDPFVAAAERFRSLRRRPRRSD
jgi:hypothetical protein